jgi:hypothetical protein
LTQVDDWIKKLAMARQLRIQYEGAIYPSDEPRRSEWRDFSGRSGSKSFLATLGAACQKSGWQVPLVPSLNACFVLVAMNISAPTELKLYKAIFVCRTLLAGSLPSNPSGTDETLGIHYPQELNVVHIPDRKGT